MFCTLAICRNTYTPKVKRCYSGFIATNEKSEYSVYTDPSLFTFNGDWRVCLKSESANSEKYEKSAIINNKLTVGVLFSN